MEKLWRDVVFTLLDVMGCGSGLLIAGAGVYVAVDKSNWWSLVIAVVAGFYTWRFWILLMGGVLSESKNTKH